MVSNRPYISVLKDLERRRQAIQGDLLRLQEECAELDLMIVGIAKLIPVATKPTNDGKPLSEMSMRWAILTVLGVEEGTSMAVGEIHAALLEGGFPESDKFKSNVSAVLSRMGAAGEVQNNSGSYRITERGRGALRVIQTRPRRSNLKSLNGGVGGEETIMPNPEASDAEGV